MDNLAIGNEFENGPIFKLASCFSLNKLLLFRQEMGVTQRLQLHYFFLRLLYSARRHLFHLLCSDHASQFLLLSLIMHHNALAFFNLTIVLCLEYLLSLWLQ